MNDHDLLRRFEAADIPRESWTHRAHLRVAYLYLRRLPFADALTCLRAGIQALNAANGVHNGYHETVTAAFAHLVEDAMRRSENAPAITSDEFCDAHPELFTRELLLRYYSRELITSDRARNTFVIPDILPLPASPTIR